MIKYTVDHTDANNILQQRVREVSARSEREAANAISGNRFAIGDEIVVSTDSQIGDGRIVYYPPATFRVCLVSPKPIG